MQEAYLSAFASLGTFRGDASLSTWLTRIVVNKAVSRLQQEDMALPLDELEKIDCIQAEVVGMPHLDPEAAAARSQVRELLEREIDNLPRRATAAPQHIGVEIRGSEQPAHAASIIRPAPA
jgi:RNA polymerase sigma-70 factor (ECF subfamily)